MDKMYAKKNCAICGIEYQPNSGCSKVCGGVCRKKMKSQWESSKYHKNPEHRAKVKKYIQGYSKVRRVQNWEWLRDYKKKLKCSCCGFSDWRALQFHHRDQSLKESTITKLVNDGYSRERVMNEIKKCDVLCANCHVIHHFENGWKQ